MFDFDITLPSSDLSSDLYSQIYYYFYKNVISYDSETGEPTNIEEEEFYNQPIVPFSGYDFSTILIPFSDKITTCSAIIPFGTDSNGNVIYDSNEFTFNNVYVGMSWIPIVGLVFICGLSSVITHWICHFIKKIKGDRL